MATIVITGASSGIGKALYDYYKSQKDNTVIGVSRSGPDLKLDLTAAHSDDYSRIGQTVECAIGERTSKTELDLLINCAGIMKLPEYPCDRQIFDVNFWAPFWLAHTLIPNLQETKGCVINIASVVASVPDADLPIYCASKAALISLTKSMALRYAPYIRFNAISPGFVKTNLVPSEETPQHLIDNVPMHYEADPTELCTVVDTAASTRYITGANIVIDGGLACKGGS